MRYLKEYNKYTGSIKATIFFLQAMYWFEKMKGKPFFKFNKPCSHPFYKDGDSWTEELDFSIGEFILNRKQCSSKLKLHTEYPLIDKKLILFWSSGYNVTVYLPNFYKLYELNKIENIFERDFPLFRSWVSQLRKREKYIPELRLTPIPNMNFSYSYIQKTNTEENTNNNTESVLSQFNFSDLFLLSWTKWKAHHVNKAKKEMTLDSEKKLLESIANFEEDFSIQIIREAIANNWTNFYFAETELKYKNYLATKNKANGTIKSKTGETFDAHVVDALRKYS